MATTDRREVFHALKGVLGHRSSMAIAWLTGKCDAPVSGPQLRTESCRTAQVAANVRGSCSDFHSDLTSECHKLRERGEVATGRLQFCG